MADTTVKSVTAQVNVTGKPEIKQKDDKIKTDVEKIEIFDSREKEETKTSLPLDDKPVFNDPFEQNWANSQGYNALAALTFGASVSSPSHNNECASTGDRYEWSNVDGKLANERITAELTNGNPTSLEDLQDREASETSIDENGNLHETYVNDDGSKTEVVRPCSYNLFTGTIGRLFGAQPEASNDDYTINNYDAEGNITDTTCRTSAVGGTKCTIVFDGEGNPAYQVFNSDEGKQSSVRVINPDGSALEMTQNTYSYGFGSFTYKSDYETKFYGNQSRENYPIGLYSITELLPDMTFGDGWQGQFYNVGTEITGDEYFEQYGKNGSLELLF